MFDRREFIMGTGAVLTVAAYGAPSIGDELTATTRKKGVQLYTLRRSMKKDVVKTLRAVANIGYEEVEFAGYFGHSSKDMRSILDGEGLTAPASHIGFEAFSTDLDRVIEDAIQLGHEYLVVPHLSHDRRKSLDDYHRIANDFTLFGQKCRAAGIQFAYHNHAFEFEPIAGEVPYDILLRETDPSLVTMELDLYWVSKAGQSAEKIIEANPGRFKLFHVKDMDANGEITEVGKGVIDFDAIFSKANIAGLEHAFVEHDQPTDAIQSIEYSFRSLSRIEWMQVRHDAD